MSSFPPAGSDEFLKFLDFCSIHYQGLHSPAHFPLAASVAANQHFVGERPFREILFEKGLPWVFVFDGLDDRPGDGTVVVLGDLDALFQLGCALWARTADQHEARERLTRLEELRQATDPARQGELIDALRLKDCRLKLPRGCVWRRADCLQRPAPGPAGSEQFAHLASGTSR